MKRINTEYRFYYLMLLATIMLISIEWLLSVENSLFTRMIVTIGTLALAFIHVLSYVITVRSIGSKNPYAFVRGVMGSTFVKFFLCIAAVGILLFATHKHLHKPDLFLLMFVYIIYTVIETAILTTVSRTNKLDT